MTDNTSNIFRKKTIDRISSPEQLTDYLHVTNPGIWIILVAVILLLAGIFAWSGLGTLETKAAVKVIVEDHAAQIIPLESETLEAGMPLRVDEKEFVLNSTETDGYGRSIAYAEVSLADGTYDGTIVIETLHPIEFLLTSR